MAGEIGGPTAPLTLLTAGEERAAAAPAGTLRALGVPLGDTTARALRTVGDLTSSEESVEARSSSCPFFLFLAFCEYKF